MYIYIYVYMYMHVYTHTHTHTLQRVDAGATAAKVRGQLATTVFFTFPIHFCLSIQRMGKVAAKVVYDDV